ncbi:uncharacterized protein DUF2793 [Gemmobacter caeni]|uniref:Uncharacterized protein DUF2793 n=1 Tax=Gemmobacter caeni TaxID=589035 RepID=A0A2T6AT53_9RHOB|nr:DUF2793 domain-containing protein [Gemmobacter caeni]PTX46999.1 uncharacterized protein DUF2793 [Gemmobacter caeni]TWI96144.1 uncharacterized protein DUF2793 [Gemmobacter caeni]
MPSTTIPGIGIEARWAEGENGWKPGMDENLVRLSALTQMSVPSVTAALSTANGVQIAPPSHANAGQVALSVGGAWWYYAPFQGMRVWVRDVQSWFVFDGSAWVRESGAAHVISPVVSASRLVTESEFAVGATIEVSSETDVVLTVPGPGTTAPQLGASVARRPITVIRTGAGNVSVAAAAGSTLMSAGNAFRAREQGSAFVIIPLTGDRYSVQGDVT